MSDSIFDVIDRRFMSGKLRKERMEAGWKPVRMRAYHKPYLNKQGR